MIKQDLIQVSSSAFSYFVIKYSHIKRCFEDVKSGQHFRTKIINRIKVNGHSETWPSLEI